MSMLDCQFLKTVRKIYDEVDCSASKSLMRRTPEAEGGLLGLQKPDVGCSASSSRTGIRIRDGNLDSFLKDGDPESEVADGGEPWVELVGCFSRWLYVAGVGHDRILLCRSSPFTSVKKLSAGGIFSSKIAKNGEGFTVF